MNGPLGLRAPIMMGGNFNRAHGVGLGASRYFFVVFLGVFRHAFLSKKVCPQSVMSCEVPRDP